MNDNTWPSIPANIRTRLTELDQHDYWGEDFAQGKMSYFLVKKNNGAYVLVATSGDAQYWIDRGDAAVGKVFDLRHTQTFAVTRGTLVGTIDNNTNVSQFGITRKIPTWTLK